MIAWRFAPHNHADQADIGRQSLRLFRPRGLSAAPLGIKLNTMKVPKVVVELDVDDKNIGALWARSQFDKIEPEGRLRRTYKRIHFAVAVICQFFNLLLLLTLTLLALPISFLRNTHAESGKEKFVVLHANTTLRIFSALARINPALLVLKTSARLQRTAFKENRRPILYLRSFRMDCRKDIDWHHEEFRMPKNITNGVIENTALPLEFYLKAKMQLLGPFIAIGKQSNDRNIDNAIRFDVGDDNWKSHVLSLMEKCIFIIVCPEYTPGTIWEVDQIFNNKSYLEKTIFINPKSAGRFHGIHGDKRIDYGIGDDNFFRDVCSKLVGGEVVTTFCFDSVQCAFFKNDSLFLIHSDFSCNSDGWAKSAKFATYLIRENVTNDEVIKIKNHPYLNPLRGNILASVRN